MPVPLTTCLLFVLLLDLVLFILDPFPFSLVLLLVVTGEGSTDAIIILINK